MKTILKFLALFILFFFMIGEMKADIHVIVFGKGGIIVKPDSTTVVCPETSQDKCAEITLESSSLELTGPFNGMNGTLTYDGNKYHVVIVEIRQLKEDNGEYACQGIVVENFNP